MNTETILTILNKEIEQATGCTEIGSIALAASRAAMELGSQPEKVEVTVSTNFYKNAANVGVPGTSLRGIKISAALGCLLPRTNPGLDVLNDIDDKLILQAQNCVSEGRITVSVETDTDPVYVKVNTSNLTEKTSVEILHEHSFIAQVTKNGNIRVSNSFTENNEKSPENILKQYSLQDLIGFVRTMDPSDLSFLVAAAKINYEAALLGLENSSMRFGPALRKMPNNLPVPFTIIHEVQTLTGAASEARMKGLKVPIMTITGSGNHGITNFLGTYVFAKQLGADEETLARALAISSMVTVYIKGFTSRLTAYCGCAIAPAAGIAAAGVYLLGGEFEDMLHAMQSVIGTFSGMLCDGAKESCSYKVSTVAGSAAQFAQLAMEGAYLSSGNGILGQTIEESFMNLGLLNDPGMKETEKLVIQMIEKNLQSS